MIQNKQERDENMKIGNIEVYGIIYKIINKINNKVYIGQTKNGFNKRYDAKGVGIERVYNYYKNNITTGKYNQHLINSIKKYGCNNFEVVEILDVAFSKKELDIKEKVYISIFDSTNKSKGYNKRDGGNDGFQTIESKNKNSISKLGFDIMKSKEDIIESYLRKKENINSISNRYNVNDEVIRRVLIENGVKLRNFHEVRLGYNPYDYEDEIIGLYKKDKNKSKIAKKLNISYSSISAILNKNGYGSISMKESCKYRNKLQGKDNPASVKVKVYDKNRNCIENFESKKQCSEWLVNNKICNNINSANSAIDRSIKYNRLYKGLYYFEKYKHITSND